MTLGMDRAAEDVRRRLGIVDGARDAEAVAIRCGLLLCPREGCRGSLEDGVIFYGRGISAEERQKQVARELGRWILIRYGLDGGDEQARYVGGLVIDGPWDARKSGVMEAVR
jgi:hypothetical protein